MWKCSNGHPNPDDHKEMIGPPALPFCECVWPEEHREFLKNLKDPWPERAWNWVRKRFS